MENASAPQQARFVVITGLSGSGKSTSLKALEDMGFYAVDNLPVELLPAFVNLPLSVREQSFQVALGMDARGSGFADSFPGILRRLAGDGFNIELLFLEASEEVLIRRYSQTRRQHPLAAGHDGQVVDSIRDEKQMLAPIRELATHVLDTSRLTVHDLKRETKSLFSYLAKPKGFQINLISFGFKYGIPSEADLLMDVRFLPNPYFVEGLRPLDGRDRQVVDFVFGSEATKRFLELYMGLLDFLLPLYHKEGKSRLTIGIGCTGGHHRSVAISEWLAEKLEGEDRRIALRHRDIDLE